MNILTERVEHNGGDLVVTVKEIGSETFYSLDNILSSINKMPQLCIMEHEPISVNSRIVWGYILQGGNMIKSVFVDRNCMERLIGSAASV